jgi:hypothetical protein
MADIDNTFSFHPADTIGRRNAHADVRERCRELAHWLDEVLPPGRHKSLARTHLEDVMHRANAAIACAVEAPAAEHMTRAEFERRRPDGPDLSGPPKPGQPMTLAEAQAKQGQ